MKVFVRIYPRGAFLAEQLAILKPRGQHESKEPTVILDFIGHGVGIEMSVSAALTLGLTAEDLKAANKEPQEFEVKLQKPLPLPERAKE